MAKKHTEPYRLYQNRGVWYAYIHFVRSDGQTYHYRGTLATRERAVAERKVIEKINQCYQDNPTPTTSITLENACLLYYERHGKYLSRPLETLQRLDQLKQHLNIKNLSELSNIVISQMVDRRKHEVANATINRELMLLSSLLNKCELWGYNIPRIKISQFKLKEKAENIKYLDSWETAQKIIDNSAPHLKPIIYTALYTGLRLSNLLNLKWEEIDFSNNLINIKVKDRTKDGGKNLSIPMIDKLKKILQAQPRINEYVFNYKGKPMTSIKRAWHTALRRAKLPYTNFHTLRHTAATWILKKTGNLKLTQQILGHADIKTTTKYAHVLDEEKRQALMSVFE